jgi:hypothetical protein
MPPLTNTVEDFGTAWVKWWSKLQPVWRGPGPVFSTDTADIPEDNPWPELEKGGPNGFFLVLLSYGWWGAAATDATGKEIEPTYSEWKNQFTDIEWALENMVDHLDSSLKRDWEEYERDMHQTPDAKWFICCHVIRIASHRFFFCRIKTK